MLRLRHSAELAARVVGRQKARLKALNAGRENIFRDDGTVDVRVAAEPIAYVPLMGGQIGRRRGQVRQRTGNPVAVGDVVSEDRTGGVPTKMSAILESLYEVAPGTAFTCLVTPLHGYK